MLALYRTAVGKTSAKITADSQKRRGCSATFARSAADATRLVDQCGLKGFRHGDAQISHIHANIMVNLGHATAKDVRELISIAQEAVWAKFNLHLDVEIAFVGEFA